MFDPTDRKVLWAGLLMIALGIGPLLIPDILSKLGLDLGDKGAGFVLAWGFSLSWILTLIGIVLLIIVGASWLRSEKPKP
jgi:hypothetical protein